MRGAGLACTRRRAGLGSEVCASPPGLRWPVSLQPMANKGFTGTQKQYLEGLASGLRIARGTTRSILADVRSRLAARMDVSAENEAAHGGGPAEPALHPDQPMLDAQNRALSA